MLKGEINYFLRELGNHLITSKVIQLVNHREGLWKKPRSITSLEAIFKNRGKEGTENSDECLQELYLRFLTFSIGIYCWCESVKTVWIERTLRQFVPISTGSRIGCSSYFFYSFQKR